MNTRLLAQSIPKFPASSRLRFDIRTVLSLAHRCVVAAGLIWQAEIERRRRIRLASELRAMSNHTLRDIGVGRPAIDWVARDNS